MLDLKITDALIVDGSGGASFRGDIGVTGDTITAVGKVADPARRTIDAGGRVVSPGFIDVHTHYDAQALWDPTLSPSSFHGVTTVFGGFCGFSIAPLSEESAGYLMPMLARVEGMPLKSLTEGVAWDWASFGDYLSRIEGRLAVNAGFMAGHSAIRRYVMGPRAVGGTPTAQELEAMKALLRRCIREGALGFSTTLSMTHSDADGEPVPSRAADRHELLELFSVISEFEGTAAEMAPPGDFTDETYDWLTAVSLAAQRPVNWNLLTLHGLSADERARAAKRLAASDYAAARGASVVALTVPQTARARINLANGVIFDTIPGWAPLFKLPLPARMQRLRDPASRAALRASAATMTGLLSGMVNWPTLRIIEAFSETNRPLVGRLIGDIALERGGDPFDVFLDIALADELRTSFSYAAEGEAAEVMAERAKLWTDPRTVIGGSDAGAHLDMIDTFGVPTALLSMGVREFKVISLEEAVRQLTSKPAELMGLKGRGLLREGWRADLVVFDPETVGASKTYTRADMPGGGERLYSDAIGIGHVIVNGQEIIRDNAYLGVAAGNILRPGIDTRTVGIPATLAAE